MWPYVGEQGKSLVHKTSIQLDFYLSQVSILGALICFMLCSSSQVSLLTCISISYTPWIQISYGYKANKDGVAWPGLQLLFRQNFIVDLSLLQ